MEYAYFMKKISLVFALILVFSCVQAQTQNDFYGKWVYQNEGKMEFIISAKTFTSVWTPILITGITPAEQNTFEIFSWEKITNDNNETKKDYPTGYLVGLRHGLLGNTTAKLFMHRDKNSMISAYESRGVYHQELYIKPYPQSAFYGTWAMIDDEGKKTNLEYSITETLFSGSRNNRKLSDDRILSWESVFNKDNETKKDYPMGFLITRDVNSYSLKVEYYLHRDGKTLLQISDTNNSRAKAVFIKIKS
jgi:hypothetical protein